MLGIPASHPFLSSSFSTPEISTTTHSTLPNQESSSLNISTSTSFSTISSLASSFDSFHDTITPSQSSTATNTKKSIRAFHPWPNPSSSSHGIDSETSYDQQLSNLYKLHEDKARSLSDSPNHDDTEDNFSDPTKSSPYYSLWDRITLVVFLAYLVIFLQALLGWGEASGNNTAVACIAVEEMNPIGIIGTNITNSSHDLFEEMKAEVVGVDMIEGTSNATIQGGEMMEEQGVDLTP
ncbi:hypothetical protein ABKN59_005383 [Abortiporus biennis]